MAGNQRACKGRMFLGKVRTLKKYYESFIRIQTKKKNSGIIYFRLEFEKKKCFCAPQKKIQACGFVMT